MYRNEPGIKDDDGFFVGAENLPPERPARARLGE
jgi:hypothetical protein